LKQIYDQFFKQVEAGKNNGLVRVEFVINCVGEIGKFEIEELDYDYSVIRLNPDISKQVLQILKDAGKWVPGETRNQKVDTFKFLIFKIKNGKVEEIYP
jgi:hypothetical protein